MSHFDFSKYQAFPRINKTDRRWPDQIIATAPQWCSVDLRDGNQALIEPMTVTQKIKMFKLLLDLGFKEIEVGFPAASQPDYDFVRCLIEDEMIPADVTIQVLTQAREELISRTFESLKGVKQAIVHLYNSTSRVQRQQVFGKSREGIKQIAVNGAELVKIQADRYPETEWIFQYSPESFTGTELDYAVGVVDAVNAVWKPTAEKKVIINLPATVEMSTPNIFADQIEWFIDHVSNRDALIISLHTHNDRGCAIASAELGIMAGADRIEGTLLGNGERTGNMDIVTMAMNLYSQGVDAELNLADMDRIVECVKDCTQLPVHPRHPYAGELVFTAFSGSHQDAIRKCLSQYTPGSRWDVAYLPIDPADLGRDYQAVIRINSQSGKGGIAYVLEREHQVQIPRWLQVEFSAVVQKETENSETELNGQEIWELFQQQYLQSGKEHSHQISSYQISRQHNKEQLTAELLWQGKPITITGSGNGAVEAFVDGLNHILSEPVVLVEYSEHALSHEVGAKAICYVQLNLNGRRYSGVAISEDIIMASLASITHAVMTASMDGFSFAA
ncbi:2-isopropylmalate synthase [Motiliproteus sp. MSK22-1]|uniref:2-isopropylmalate synthase n=1 Tax=Motiliproteus sp. MSK22-1 TaxID=1897630 RepID=UPI00097662D8|nr:2-isopropylmalate synthase [Motiliproteus sp. MSK22-1]OMH25583.1 2-isopropylmalate synthase [Motiliproteus sp. MSK22-1]